MIWNSFMGVSIFDLFSIGIGPSSSHTVGPMRAAKKFLLALEEKGRLQEVSALRVDLYGSLALTGKGHGTDKAILLGLQGFLPEEVDRDAVEELLEQIRRSQSISLLGQQQVFFNEIEHLLFHCDQRLPYHSNGMRFTAFQREGKELFQQVIYSVGGGFIVEHEHIQEGEEKVLFPNSQKVPYPFTKAEELLRQCDKHHMKIRDVIWENEKTWRSEEEIRNGLRKIWKTMQECVERGCRTSGILPGGLNVKRRAPDLYQTLQAQKQQHVKEDPGTIMDWVSLWALAVNEENAAGGRVVTAPTNGAAGVIPAVLHYYKKFSKEASEEGIFAFLLTAGAIGMLYKVGASLSAAEMGCQGEVGVACSMAAGGLAAVLGGTNAQIENAAEIGMEHNLGLTCDPVKGLVQIPCIERNTMGAVKAINAARLSLQGDGNHHISLDQVIATMKQIGKDMNTIYKETSLGGLAVNFPEC